MNQSPTGDLRVAVLGVGLMGADHVRRLATTIAGARPVVVSDAFADKAHEVAGQYDGIRVVEDPFAAIADPEVDAVIIATPGTTHKKQVLTCLDRGLPVLCEKPLTTEADTALAVVRAEQALGRQLVQVGFMRRFDPEYVALRALIASGDIGEPLLVHCAHRNPAVPTSFTTEMVVTDSLVHEVDVARYLLGEEITAVTLLSPRRTSSAHDGLQDPQVALLETAGGRLVDVELFVASGIAYEVRTEVVAERGIASIGHDVKLVTTAQTGIRGGALTPGFRERFGTAYDVEVQRWVNAARRGTIDGPGAWDGYAAVAVCEAGVQSVRTGSRVEVRLADRNGAA